MQEIEELGAILGVWAHPDDETYLSGGIMAAAVDHGQRVACVTATAGERGTSDPERWPPAKLAEIRKRELEEALRLLGVREHAWMGHPDGGCEEVAHQQAVGQLGEIIARFRPDTILTFGPDGMTGHPDHITVGRWARAASRLAEVQVLEAAKDAQWIERFADLHERYDVFEPGYPVTIPDDQLALRIDLPDELLSRKIAALHAQKSQIAPIIEAFGEDRWREWIRTEAFASR